jgi:hypothetical protein
MEENLPHCGKLLILNSPLHHREHRVSQRMEMNFSLRPSVSSVVKHDFDSPLNPDP